MAATSSPTQAKNSEHAGIRLLPEVTCPHCWERFAPEAILWVSVHIDLLGDTKLGPEQQRRFLPSRFTPEGDAIDPMGMISTQLACPRCHLVVPRALLEMEPLFVSILGSPSSGKSYYLAALTWQLRSLLASNFAISFADVDASANQSLNAYEESLFLNPKPTEVVPLGDLIRKTELQGELYNTVSYGRQTVSYPRPFLFTLRLQDGHPNAPRADKLSRVLCVYDNAGEHFQPGQDSTSSPVTRHLARSALLLFLFDPTQDHRFRSVCRHSAEDGGSADRRAERQEIILNEAAERIRRFAGLPANLKHDRPLMVVVSKADEWAHLLDRHFEAEPFAPVRQGLSAIRTDLVEQQSAGLRAILQRYCPELVAAAEGFSQEVVYIPVSSIGPAIERHEPSGLMGIRPNFIRPQWVTVPLLYGLARALPGLIPRARPA